MKWIVFRPQRYIKKLIFYLVLNIIPKICEFSLPNSKKQYIITHLMDVVYNTMLNSKSYQNINTKGHFKMHRPFFVDKKQWNVEKKRKMLHN